MAAAVASSAELIASLAQRFPEDAEDLQAALEVLRKHRLCSGDRLARLSDSQWERLCLPIGIELILRDGASALRAAAPAPALAEAQLPAIPDPAYQPKMGAVRKVPEGEIVQVAEVADLAPGKTLYAFLISAVIPRPIAFVSTVSSDGVVNLAPFSFYGVMSHDPPTLVFCPIYRGGKPKDTLANCQATGECVVNMISEHFVEAANCCCGEYPPEVDEFEISGLTKVPSKLPKGTPRVKEAMVQFECKVVDVKELIGASGKGSCAIVTCEILRVHAHSAVLRKTPNGSDIVDLQDYKPISRLGGNDYARTSGVFEIPRPDKDLWKTVVCTSGQ